MPAIASQPITWAIAAPAFNRDGMLRDISVSNTCLGDWQRVLDYMRETYASIQFTLNGIDSALPIQAAQLFHLAGASSPLLLIDVDGISIACHCFDPSEIEFDFLPGDVCNANRLDAIIAFMMGIAQAVAKPIALTLENTPSAVIMRTDPVMGTVQWIPALTCAQ